MNSHSRPGPSMELSHATDVSILDSNPVFIHVHRSGAPGARARVEGMLSDLGVDWIRQSALEVEAHCLKKLKLRYGGRGFEATSRTDKWKKIVQRKFMVVNLRRALREAGRRRLQSAILVFDDTVIHPNFVDLAKSIRLPSQWDLIVLGCIHVEMPTRHDGRVVTPGSTVHENGFLVNGAAFRRFRKRLRSGALNGLNSLAEFDVVDILEPWSHFAILPNLAWSISATDAVPSPFAEDGGQRIHRHAVLELLRDQPISRGGLEPPPTAPSDGWPVHPVKLGLLFLTVGDVNHPEIWERYLATHPSAVRVFCHPKNPSEVRSRLLCENIIPDRVETRWGEISLVQATRKLMAAALCHEDLTHLILVSDSCVPVKPLSEVLRSIRIDPRSRFKFWYPRNIRAGDLDHAVASASVPAGCLRFQSQWWMLDRAFATLALERDETRRFEEVRAPDEWYFATKLVLEGIPLETTVSKRPVTWERRAIRRGSPASWTELSMDEMWETEESGAFFARKFPVGADLKLVTRLL